MEMLAVSTVMFCSLSVTDLAGDCVITKTDCQCLDSSHTPPGPPRPPPAARLSPAAHCGAAAGRRRDNWQRRNQSWPDFSYLMPGTSLWPGRDCRDL